MALVVVVQTGAVAGVRTCMCTLLLLPIPCLVPSSARTASGTQSLVQESHHFLLYLQTTSSCINSVAVTAGSLVVRQSTTAANTATIASATDCVDCLHSELVNVTKQQSC
jgi:hypothetical protein